MKKSIFVISDLHLGGAPAENGKPSFQMCSPEGHARLADFIRFVLDQQSTGREIHLVIAGDIVDFLAELQFSPFTDKDDAADKKLGKILERTDDIWKNLESYCRSGSRLTLLLGNHDLELCLPGPRRTLLNRLGSGRIEFIYDNQALVEGPVLIEHGNRYDSWNIVSHDALRHTRSTVSRNETPPPFESPAGSQLVVQVMNGIKSKFPFVDLLKPEDAGVLPLLAVLDPPAIATINNLLPLWRKQAGIEFDEITGRPMDLANIGGDTHVRDLEMIALAQRLAAGTSSTGDQADISGVVDWMKAKVETVKSVAELWSLSHRDDAEEQLDRLYDALRARVKRTWQTFDVGIEDEVYLRPAEAFAAKEFKVIVMGHTHLVKRVPLKKGQKAVYLNTGTWADLMRVPEKILTGDDKIAGKQQLVTFVEDLKANRLENWRCQIPSFARIELDGEGVESADIYQFGINGQETKIPDGRISQLMR
jgi:UDP-2,3-diacylglucosamine pyrophosphatase LpxH